MICPACASPLIAVEYDALEVDYCAACRGVWLDAGELELLFGDSRQCQAFLAGGQTSETTRKARKCPICRKGMEVWRTQGEDAIEYDRCLRGDGIWLDNGELESMMRHAPPQQGGAEVQGFLREMFGRSGENE